MLLNIIKVILATEQQKLKLNFPQFVLFQDNNATHKLRLYLSPNTIYENPSLFQMRYMSTPLFVFQILIGVSQLIIFNPRSLEGEGGGGQINPLDFFGFKFLLFDRLSKALAQLFLICENIF